MGKATTRTKPVRRGKSGKIPAQRTANTVIASEARLIEVLHFCFRRHKTAEIRVPAWPIPIQKTKLTIAQPQLTGLLLPQTPTPVETRYTKPIPVKLATHRAVMKHHHHQVGVFLSTILHIFSVTQLKLRLLRTRGASFHGAGSTFLRMAGAFVSVRVEALMS